MAVFMRSTLIAVSFFVSGCAIRPLPEDVTGAPAHIIVQQIRCETRKAIVDSALGWLTADDNLENGRVDPASRALGFDFIEGRRPNQELGPALFRGRVAQIIKVFFDTGVAYNFNLDMTEVNNLDTQIDLLKPFTNSKLSIGVKGGFDRSRRNERQFTITDSFGGLIRLPDTYCKGEGYDFNKPKNYIYPIAGEIGIKRMVQEFINLTLFSNLGGKKDAPTGPPTLVDTLTFQTLITGTLAPMITFSPVGTGLSVADASLTGVASRTDIHTLTMGLSIAGAGVQFVGPLRTAVFTSALLTANPHTRAEASAADAVNQALTQRLFKPTINVVTP